MDTQAQAGLLTWKRSTTFAGITTVQIPRSFPKQDPIAHAWLWGMMSAFMQTNYHTMTVPVPDQLAEELGEKHVSIIRSHQGRIDIFFFTDSDINDKL